MKDTVGKIGFWSGLLAASATVTYVIVQLLQLAGQSEYPLDEWLIYGSSLCIVVPFIFEMLALHYVTPQEKKFFSHAALLFSNLYAVFVTSNYVVQLATVIPMSLKGRLNEVLMLQQSPHSMFWNFDPRGYIFMRLATLVAIPIFGKSGFQKWIRIALLANALMTPLIAVVYFYPNYSYSLLVLGFPCGITAPMFMLMLALYFRKINPKRQNSNKNIQTIQIKS